MLKSALSNVNLRENAEFFTSEELWVNNLTSNIEISPQTTRLYFRIEKSLLLSEMDVIVAYANISLPKALQQDPFHKFQFYGTPCGHVRKKKGMPKIFSFIYLTRILGCT